MNAQRGNAVYWTVGIIALAIAVFFIFRSHNTAVQIEQPVGAVEGEMTSNPDQKIVLEGTVSCLPHRNTTGPTTMECAYGLKTDDGKYYGLDTTGLPPTLPPEYDVGDRISVEGTLVPQSEVPDNFWTTYNLTGFIAMQGYWKYTEK